MSSSSNSVLESFVQNYLPNRKEYYRHSDIDHFLNITITNLLNYDYLLTEDDREYINRSFHQNTKHIEAINKEKRDAFIALINDVNNKNKTKIPLHSKKLSDNENKSILTFQIPKFEIYFVGKLCVNGIPIEPEYTTKLLFSNQMEQKITMRYKYKDLTQDSYITLSIYSMQLPKGKDLLGSTTIRLFDKNFNVIQGRHVYKIFKKVQIKPTSLMDENEKDIFNEELDNLICTYYKTIKKIKDINKSSSTTSENRFTNVHDDEEVVNSFYYDPKRDEIVIKDDYLLNYESKLNLLLTQTKESFVEIDFPVFTAPIIYDEETSDTFTNTPIEYVMKDKKQTFQELGGLINDPLLQSCISTSKRNTFIKSTPIDEKFEQLALNEVSCDKDRKPTQYESERMNEMLIQPDFIENTDSRHFWNFRYYLLNQNKKSALTKICNAVVWENQSVQEEFLNNILKHWKDVEICDILYLLSRAFSLNPEYSKKSESSNNKEQSKENAKIAREGYKKLRSYAVQQLRNISDENLNFILLQLVQALRYEDKDHSELKDFLIEKCSQSPLLGTSFYWFLQVEASPPNTPQNQPQPTSPDPIIEYYNGIKNKFMNELAKYPEVDSLVQSQIKLKNTLFEISSTMSQVPKKTDARKAKFKELIDPHNEKGKEIYNEHSLPLDPHLKVHGVIKDKCTVFRSAMFPVKYTFKVTNDTQEHNPGEEKDKFEVMFKYGDDLRQDQLILQIFNYMDSILQKVHLDYEFTTYKVLATSKTDGFVEFVPNSKTIFDISKEYSKNIRKYLEEHSLKDQQDMNKKIDSFVNSCAGYCVVTYLLGIGDRHLENLLVNKNGKLFHIDFGYILGKDPKPYPPPMKINSEMMECIGDDKWEEFKTKCVNAFWVLRDNARLIVNLFYLMIDAGIPELNDVEILSKLNDKFVQQQTRQQASLTLVGKIEGSTRKIYSTLDFAHSLATKFH